MSSHSLILTVIATRAQTSPNNCSCVDTPTQYASQHDTNFVNLYQLPAQVSQCQASRCQTRSSRSREIQPPHSPALDPSAPNLGSRPREIQPPHSPTLDPSAAALGTLPPRKKSATETLLRPLDSADSPQEISDILQSSKDYVRGPSRFRNRKFPLAGLDVFLDVLESGVQARAPGLEGTLHHETTCLTTRCRLEPHKSVRDMWSIARPRRGREHCRSACDDDQRNHDPRLGEVRCVQLPRAVGHHHVGATDSIPYTHEQHHRA